MPRRARGGVGQTVSFGGPKLQEQRWRPAEGEEGSGTRNDSGETQEYESCQNDMDEDEEELSFVPSAVSDSAGWREPKFVCKQAVQGRRLQVL